ncbi:S-phase kinase-associated protein 2 isoform X1 [Pristis pectinata]|uniref:S-phase kinase-associated protein 2 isoform X1 n=2 Tax=Pristis pectinata TaxID=685728 RepID=UPI00223D865C|nr:S-phase kinase-associated protein 2 isoform X1 [Pristis pectinata]
MRGTVHREDTPSNCSSATFTWSWDPVETRSLMTVMGVRQIEEDTKTLSEDPEQSPPSKRPRHCQGKENQPHSFLVTRRFRKPDCSSGVTRSWEELPDELLLVIFHSLSLPHLLKVSQVSRRWHRLAFDKSLWYSVDLSKASLPSGTLGQVLGAGVVILRSPRSFLGDPMFKDDRLLPLQHLDLSHCVTSSSAIFQILRRCNRLLGLSLEGLSLSDDVIRAVGCSQQLVRLNLCSCSRFGPDSFRQMLNDCPRLDELNVSWCEFGPEHIQVMVTHVPSTVTQLNISGHRHCLRNSDVQVLCQRCPRITNLDMSDSTMLTPGCFPALQQLSHLQHLGLSRCHEIPPAALMELGEIATLKTLSIYGLVRDSTLNVKELIPQIKINTFPLTSIARPTPGHGKSRKIWGIACRLELRTL